MNTSNEIWESIGVKYIIILEKKLQCIEDILKTTRHWESQGIKYNPVNTDVILSKIEAIIKA